MPRLPLIPTIVVGLAIAVMIGLGVWQLQRKGEKEALIARYTANLSQGPITFPQFPVGEENLFRRSSLMCIRVVGWQTVGGRATGGGTGWRHIAECTRGAEGVTVKVDMGISSDPKVKPVWTGGQVAGTLTHAPQNLPLIAQLFGSRAPAELMLVAESPAPGLQPSARPDPSGVPNNHLAYAVQWFLFALIAAVIYPLALAYRQRGRQPPESSQPKS